MTANLPPREPLVGRRIRLTPFTEADLPELDRVLRRPEVFAGGFGGGPAGLPSDAAAFAEFGAACWSAGPAALPFTVRIEGGPDHGAVIGATKLGDLEPEREKAHIGWTAYAPEVWGTVVNPEAKLLLLGLAFDHGFGRVRLQADALNARSRAAILKLGASFEGIARRDQPRADGTWRDTAIHSILIDEWPDVRERLQARVDAWGDRPVALGAVAD
ncbi:GNAT family N-acetyltransferase [Agromyces sp. LHK192]|uniref:GNAT family N-acetyltransferase n=1 Tax=Agromyces sp. LHK192 TaxID=2498704 RepID=UPI000FD9C1A4|nr:GNAT family protein [Agromyces sp. LHK192]